MRSALPGWGPSCVVFHSELSLPVTLQSPQTALNGLVLLFSSLPRPLFFFVSLFFFLFFLSFSLPPLLPFLFFPPLDAALSLTGCAGARIPALGRVQLAQPRSLGPGPRRVRASSLVGAARRPSHLWGRGWGRRAERLMAGDFKVGPYSHSDERASFYRLFERIFHNYNKHRINEAEGNGILVQ